MLIFNVCLFPPVTYIIYLNSITILGWRTKGSVESVTLAKPICSVIQTKGYILFCQAEKLSFIQQQFAFIGD